MTLVAITGGARSGKSGVAQRLVERRSAASDDSVRVVVFGRCDGSDPEFGERVAHHRASRPGSWETAEVSSTAAVRAALDFGGLVLIDCLGTLLGLVMEECYDEAGGLGDAPADALPSGYSDAVIALFGTLVRDVLAREGDTIVVTNEVGDGLAPAYASGRLFRDVLGRANRTVTHAADAAYVCMCGRLIDLARLPADIQWPAD